MRKSGDIDAKHMKVHIRLGKGQKDRFVTLPDITFIALRYYWKTHRHPSYIFPNGKTSAVRHTATETMNRSGRHLMPCADVAYTAMPISDCA
jgi:integrase/recombinase XerD